MNDLTGTTLGGRYAIERELGRGGMATVWLARDTDHERQVAIKTLHPELAGAIAVDRFVRELRLTARLQHPNILPLLDSGVLTRPDGTTLPWYAMPYLRGESLRARLERERQLPIDEALRITRAVGDALEAAHEQQVIHRDIKPENIFLAGDHVYVLDFGIAKALGAPDAERLTSTGLMIGTPAYMSPEQCVDGSVDPRSDQYSLATVLYEMLAGEPPFAGSSAQGIIARRIGEPARPLRTVRSTIPAGLERVTLRALERSPADRFASVGDFLRALGTAHVAHGPDGARRHRVRWTVALFLVVALASAGTWGWATPARADAAFEVARRLSSDVEAVNALAGEALSLARSGRTREARDVLGRAETLATPYDPIPLHTAVYFAQVHVAIGERAMAVRLLGTFPQPRNGHFQLHLRCDPPFMPLARDPGFRALVVSSPDSLGHAC
jgi:serine/threonine-protein kinase